MKHIIANFKSNKNKTEMEHWVEEFSQGVRRQPPISHIVLCPPLPHLRAVSPLSSEAVSLGVQDLSPFPAGSYTGAVSTQNLIGTGVRYAILGHSERRRYFHETDQDVANKVHEAVAADITPIVCVTREQIDSQANSIDAAEREKIMVAYEPIEHIGTGTSDSLENIIETRQWVRSAFGAVPYIYGGSVNPSTDIQILQHPEIDGFLVGTACLDPRIFTDFLMICQ